MKNYYCLLLVLAFYSKGYSSANDIIKNKARPNVILILMDDMGYGDLAVTGALNFQTPHIDQLANSGMRFTNFWLVNRYVLHQGPHF